MPDYLFEDTSVCGFGLITSAQNGPRMLSTGNLQKKKGTVIKWMDSANVPTKARLFTDTKVDFWILTY